MRLRYFTLMLAAVGLLSACSQENLTLDKEEEKLREEEKIQAIVPGKAIVLFTEELIEAIEQDLDNGQVVTKSAGLNALASDLGVTSMERVFPYAGEYEERTRAAGLHRWYSLRRMDGG